MPPWLLSVPTISGTIVITAFLYYLFSGKIALGREVEKEKQRADEYRALLTQSQADMKKLQELVVRLTTAVEKISRKRGNE